MRDSRATEKWKRLDVRVVIRTRGQVESGEL